MENLERTYKTVPNRINVDEKYYFRIRKYLKDLHRNPKRSKQIYIAIRKDLSRSTSEFFGIRKDLSRSELESERSEQIYIGIRKDLSRSTLESEKI